MSRKKLHTTYYPCITYLSNCLGKCVQICHHHLHVRKAIRPPVPEIIDPVFAKTSPNCSFSVIENERFGLVFTKTGL
jgi:hypothetical protein